tara:strand:+ start:384 stop:737 length:354 start_codon:yes stop_codon:yes gene_type:complete
MRDKSELLRQIRKHTKNFSSATDVDKKINQKSINHALALIDLFSKDSCFGSSNKLVIKVPKFLETLRIEDNLNFLKINRIKDNPANYKKCTNKINKKKDKFKNAEKRLLKLLSTKSC